MSDILCIYYSRSGQTQKAMEEIGAALGAEVVSITDGQDRTGWKGFFRSGMEAMRPSTRPLQPYTTERPLEEYKLVIIGTPVWAGRCSSVVRAFLKRRGMELQQVGYVLTRSSENNRYEEVAGQMDEYIPQPHVLFGSVRPEDTVSYGFWRDKFIQEVQTYLNGAL